MGRQAQIALCVAAFSTFGLASLLAVDVLSDMVCYRVPVVFYAAAVALGTAQGFWFAGPFSRWWSRSMIPRFLAGAALVCGLSCAVYLSTYSPPWYSKCAFTNCGRALGVDWTTTPFPIQFDCGAYNLCANEYAYPKAQFDQLVNIMAAHGCDPP